MERGCILSLNTVSLMISVLLFLIVIYLSFCVYLLSLDLLVLFRVIKEPESSGFGAKPPHTKEHRTVSKNLTKLHGQQDEILTPNHVPSIHSTKSLHNLAPAYLFSLISSTASSQTPCFKLHFYYLSQCLPVLPPSTGHIARYQSMKQDNAFLSWVEIWVSSSYEV